MDEMGPGEREALARERLAELEPGADLETVLAFFDTLAPVTVREMIGAWRGSGLPTGNPLDGLLEALDWHGKRFDGPDAAHPLVFGTGSGRLVSVNPSVVPLSFLVRHARLLSSPAARGAFTAVRPLLRTSRPRARLRMVEYRGTVSGTMSYDALPINDVFRKVDQDTLVGAMDLRGMDEPFMFVLRREVRVSGAGSR